MVAYRSDWQSHYWKLGILFFLDVSRLSSISNTGKSYLLVSVGARDGAWEKNWLDEHAAAGFRFRPLFIEADPSKAAALSKLAEIYGGDFVEGAAWIKDGEKRLLQFAGSQLGSIVTRKHVGINRSAVWVNTVHLHRLLQNTIREMGSDVYAVMRMDCEGAEYELLRDLIVRGTACKLQQIYVETHAMFMPSLYQMRPVDVVLSWLLGAPNCNVEVFVDNHYFLETAHWQAQGVAWPYSDGECAQCPLLYRPLPPDLDVSSCPASAMPYCFDEEHTCERCCNLSYGLRGDETCWNRDVGWDARINKDLFGYEFCCALMTPTKYVRHADHFLVDSVGLEAASNWQSTSRLLKQK